MIIERPPLNPAASADKVFDWKHDPRAIGWISALWKDGGTNVAPISVFSPAGRGLPMVRISLRSRSDGVTLKDTIVNIRDVGQRVANVLARELAEQMCQTAFEYPPGADEFEEIALEKAASIVIPAPCVAASPISMKCSAFKIIAVNDIGEQMVIGEALRFQIRDEANA